MNDLVPLRLLGRGQIGEIGQLMGLPEQVQRLQELGLHLGTHVVMIQPGSPCIIRLSGNKLCFRECDLTQVLVRPGAVA